MDQKDSYERTIRRLTDNYRSIKRELLHLEGEYLKMPLSQTSERIIELRGMIAGMAKAIAIAMVGQQDNELDLKRQERDAG